MATFNCNGQRQTLGLFWVGMCPDKILVVITKEEEENKHWRTTLFWKMAMREKKKKNENGNEYASRKQCHNQKLQKHWHFITSLGESRNSQSMRFWDTWLISFNLELHKLIWAWCFIWAASLLTSKRMGFYGIAVWEMLWGTRSHRWHQSAKQGNNTQRECNLNSPSFFFRLGGLSFL